jgi:glycosyltransferase involved in cell wall biosynthesis
MLVGSALALIEAMLCSRLGIVTNEGGTSEVVEEGRTGFIANSAKVDELDNAMERAWTVRARWESIGKAAGLAVRGIVPLEPVASFTAKLLGLVDSGSLSSKVPPSGVSAPGDLLSTRGSLGTRSLR